MSTLHYGTTTIARIATFVGLSLIAFALGATSPAIAADSSVPPLVREMGTTLGFSEEAISRLMAGEIISTNLKEGSRKEIALAVAMLVDTSHENIFQRIKNGEWFSIDRTVLASAELTGPITAASFSDLDLPAEEARRLAGSKLGASFNLSTQEIGRLHGSPGDASSRLNLYRSILAERATTYRRDGLAGIAPYSRGGSRTASARADLETAAAALSGMNARCGEFYQAFAEYPNHASPSVTHRFFWALQKIQNRPTVALSHWSTQLHTGYGLVAERQYYVGQSYNALQIVAGAFSLGDSRSIVFYTNRTASDQLAGFGSSAAHAIGRRFMLREIEELFESMRRAFGSESENS